MAAAGKRKGKGKSQEAAAKVSWFSSPAEGDGGSADGGAGAEVRIDSSGRKRKKLTFAMEEYRSGATLPRSVIVSAAAVVVVCRC